MNRSELDKELLQIDQISEAGPIQEVGPAVENQALLKSIDRAVWATWWIGTLFIVLSWFNVVSSTFGWIGFAAALASTVVSGLVRKYWNVPR